MTTPTEPRLSQLVAGATADIQTLIRGEIQLAKTEIKDTVGNAGRGAGFALGAAAFLLFATLIFAFSLSYGIAEGFNWPTWSGFAITGLLLVLLAALLGFLAYRKAKRIKGPEVTIAEANKTKAAIVDRQGKGAAAGLYDPDL